MLNNIFSTILNLASLQILNSFSLKQTNLRPFRSIRIVIEKIFNSHSEPRFRLFQRSRFLKKWLFIAWSVLICLIWIFQYVKYLFESQGVLTLVQEKGIWALVVRFFTIKGS